MRLISPSIGCFAMSALVAMTVVLPVSSSGCGRSACFVFSQSEFALHNQCPAAAVALASFTDAQCPGPVVSVDGEGVFTLNEQDPAQSLCCYPVTQKDIDRDLQNGECSPPAFGGAGGVGGGFGGSFGSEVAVGVGGIGGSAGTGGCVTCGQLFQGAEVDSSFTCSSDTTVLWQDLQACACADASPCAKLCALNLCKDKPVSKECRGCLEDASTSSCQAEVFDCKSH